MVPVASAIGLLALIAPLVAFTHSAVLDYPFELARIAILARILEGSAGPEDHLLAGWRLPNMLGDALGAVLSAWMSVEAAARIVAASALVLQVTGVGLLAAAWRHPNPFLAALAASVIACNHIAAMGFTNFQLGTGLGLVALAAWVHLRARAPALAVLVAAAASPVIASAHLFAWLAFTAAIGGRMLAEIWRQRTAAAVVRGVGVGAACTLGVAVWLWPWFLLARGEQSPVWDMESKIGGFAAFFMLDPTWRGLVWCGVMSFVVVFAVLKQGWRTDRGVAWMVGAVLVLVLLLPTHSATTVHLDMRVLVFAALVAVACARPARDDARRLRSVVTVLLLLHALRIGLYAPVWIEVDRTLARIMAAGDAVPRPAVVFVARGMTDPTAAAEPWQPPIHHAAAMLASRPGLHVPQMWAERGQTIIARPDWLAPARRLQGSNPRELRDLAALDRLLAAIAAVPTPLDTPMARALLVLRPDRIGPADATSRAVRPPAAAGRHFELHVLSTP